MESLQNFIIDIKKKLYKRHQKTSQYISRCKIKKNDLK